MQCNIIAKLTEERIEVVQESAGGELESGILDFRRQTSGSANPPGADFYQLVLTVICQQN
jgi:hypothetical protein